MTYSFSTRDQSGTPLDISFEVQKTTIDPTKDTFMKVDSGTYSALIPYIARLRDVVMSPSDPISPFRVITSGIIFVFSWENGEWTLAYQAPAPIFQDHPVPVVVPPTPEEIAAAANHPLPWQLQ